MEYLQIARILCPYLIGAVIAGGCAWKIQGIRMDALKNRLAVQKAEILSCQDANKVCGETIIKLKADIQKATANCEKRISVRNELMDRIREIDELKPNMPDTTPRPNLPGAGKEGKYVENGLTGGTDPILYELNRVWVGPANK